MKYPIGRPDQIGRGEENVERSRKRPSIAITATSNPITGMRKVSLDGGVELGMAINGKNSLEKRA